MKELICDVVDLLMPGLTPYESALYFLLLRLSVIETGTRMIRVGKKIIAARLGASSRAATAISYAQVTDVLKGLEAKGCIVVGDTTREGTLYTIFMPRDVPFVKEKLTAGDAKDEHDDYFTDPAKRLELFERDHWTCHYCGERVTQANVTLDHFVPQSKGGGHTKANLHTSCLACNSIKSGKTFDEAAPLILRSIQERRQRRNK